jgi:hypothetical protein
MSMTAFAARLAHTLGDTIKYNCQNYDSEATDQRLAGIQSAHRAKYLIA